MPEVMEHVRQLAEVIGPRPAATDAEASAADYIEDVFRARGLEVERQEFNALRTTSWTHAACHLLTLAAVALTFWLPIVALVPAVAAAVLLWLELNTRSILSRVMPKGPSQNVIARHIPRQRRGERLKRVVIVAHYDSPKPSLAFSPGLVKNRGLLLAVTTGMTFLVPVVILVAAMPFAEEWMPWTGYAALAAGAGLVVPLFIAIHRELFMHATDGANGNASGVAAMLAVMEATVPEPDEAQPHERAYRRGIEAAYEAGVAPDDALLEYRPTGEGAVPVAEDMPLGGFGDVDWETGRLAPVTPTEPVTPSAPVSERVADVRASGDWAEEAGVGPLWEEPQERPGPTAPPEMRPAPRPAPAPVPARWEAPVSSPEPDEDLVEGQERMSFESAAPDEPEPSGDDEKHGVHGISAWLGIGRGFEVRKAGKQIGSWDNIDDDDEFGFKAGTAGEDEFSTGAETAGVAARIRRRVTESVDRALVEKEIWFVATGADEAGMSGMRAFLEANADDLADALIINIENVGAGTVAFVTEEGAMRTYRSDRRLVTQAKRTVRENELLVKGHTGKRLETSATPALARRFKAMSVMAFDINGRIPNWRWHSDTAENVTAKTVEQAAAFVTALVRDL
ncbi:MAG: M28 family peptidase [Coriobacteriia bacterium]